MVEMGGYGVHLFTTEKLGKCESVQNWTAKSFKISIYEMCVAGGCTYLAILHPGLDVTRSQETVVGRGRAV